MLAIQQLAVVFLVAQFIASTLLVISALFDSVTFGKIQIQNHTAVPGFRKIVQLFRTTDNRIAMGLYFLAMAHVAVSYFALVLMVTQFLARFFI